MRKWAPLIAISLGTLMLLVDVTIVNVALPAMADDLKAPFSTLQWVIDVYALALAALVLAAGTVADRIGHRTAYLGGLGLFAMASAASGLADTATLLVIARGVQGLGGAIMFATTFALLNSSYTGKDRGAAYGVWGAVSGMAAAIGPIAGGLLVEHLSWRWIFFVNLPISVLAIVMVVGYISVGDRRADQRLDVAGMLSFTLSASALTFGLIRGAEDGWTSSTVLASFVVAAAALIAFVSIELRIAQPLLDLRLLRHRPFVGSMLAGGILTLTAFANLAYVAIWLQNVQGLSPVEAGLVSSPLAVAAFVVSAVTGRVVHGRAPHLVIGGGVLLVGIGELIVWLQLGDTSGWGALMAGLIVVGLGVGLATPMLSSTAMGAVDPRRGGMAAGAVNTSRQLGFAIGIAALGAVFTAHVGQQLHQYPITDATRAAAADGLSMTFLVAGIIGVVAGLAITALIRQPLAKEAELQPVQV
ncbi:MFS transporter [Antrihabitans cavernicola]|uniref:MFS transporter n=1 Tax=Antrihabitans cavernicola TaxID=2495913 RepID=A0A5A7SBY8_9NOCA|nr:MFS transporter [Spelaeibacter cavernicola]KAA0021751.1 MFS transporter [Spelaeibacter cavernicola]